NISRTSTSSSVTRAVRARAAGRPPDLPKRRWPSLALS
ncbi:hypothetical protein AK812_SmicGene48554, partial [Symbiodinium microadriaticum]